MENEKNPFKRWLGHFEHWQVIAVFLAIYDFIAVCASYFLALLLRFDGTYSAIEKQYIVAYNQFILPAAAISIIIFIFFRMYSGMWRFASFSELVRTILGSLTSSLLHTVLITVLLCRMCLSYYLIGAGLQIILLVGIRFSYRFIQIFKKRHEPVEGKRVMLIGAGNSGQLILRDISRATEIKDKVVCIIDDNKNKWNRYLNGIPIVGGRDEILAAAKKYKVDEIFLAIPSASVQQKRDILSICNETGCKLRQLPGMYQFVTGEISVSAMKEVAIDDLLGRDPIKADLAEVFMFITGKTVMVTGGGGSIGSELCRQIAAHKPKQLIIFDIYENNAYDIQLELKEKYPELKLETLIGSVRDSRRMFEVFEKYHPQIVYHAAAHKHVPLMEDSPCEAIKNNAIGTYKTLMPRWFMDARDLY